MKNQFAGQPTQAILLSFAILALAVRRRRATLRDPTRQHGALANRNHSTVTGIENTPMAGMASALGRAHVSQSCLTPEKWKSDIQGFNARQQHSCTLSNLHQDAHEISFDEACGGGSNHARTSTYSSTAPNMHTEHRHEGRSSEPSAAHDNQRVHGLALPWLGLWRRETGRGKNASSSDGESRMTRPVAESRLMWYPIDRCRDQRRQPESVYWISPARSAVSIRLL